MITLINADGGAVTVVDDLAEAYLSAGFKPVESAKAEEMPAAKKQTAPKKTAVKKTSTK